MHNIIFFLKKNEYGTGITAQYLSKTYPNSFSSYDYCNEEIPHENRIWRIQNPFLYNYSIIDRVNDKIMLRKNFCNIFPGFHLVDGYSYYRNNISAYDSWFPTIYQSNFSKNCLPSIGYYYRDFRQQSNNAFLEFIKNISEEIPIITMGKRDWLDKVLMFRKNWTHTYNNYEFWKLCSHYFYYRCSDFEDPFPQSLLEAIQSQHRIISPKNKNRNFVDGIDDFLSCLDEYDETFEENMVGKKCECLQASTWKSFITNLEKSNFQRPSILYNKGLLYDWICKNL